MVVKDDEGWVYDEWSTDGNIGNNIAPGGDIGTEASGSGRWDSMLSIGRRLFSRGKEEQSSLGRAFFNVERSPVRPLESVLVPLIDRQSGEGNSVEDTDARDVTKNNLARSATSATSVPRRDLRDLQLSRIPLEPDGYAASKPGASRNSASDRLGPSSYEVDIGDLKPGVFIPLEDLDLGSEVDWSIGDGAARMSLIEQMRSLAQDHLPIRDWRSAGSLHWLSSWWQKVLEVLPVLAVVTLGVVGTFLYLLIADGWWQVRRGVFSLTCDVGEGKWVRSLDRPLYSATCPYIRNSWNCHKYGWATAGFSLASDSPMGIGIGLGTWRWEPTRCSIPRFEAHEFLRVMRNRHLAFVGDQSAANAFDSMACMLAEAGAPRLISPSQWDRRRKKVSGGSNVEEASSAGSGKEEEASFTDSDSGSIDKSGWGGWGFHWGSGKHNSSVALGVSEQMGLEEKGWRSRVMHYSFHPYNFTLSLYLSPFLVEINTDFPVNASRCQLSKLTPPHVVPTPEEVIAACYPNKVMVDQLDPLWASDSLDIDVLILNSGRDWREEEVEAQGLGFFKQGERQPQLSVEGYSGEWAYPVAMQEVGAWVGNKTNFKGKAIFRSYAPGHNRRECAGKVMVTPDMVRGSSMAEEAERYNEAMMGGVNSPQVRFSNMSGVAMQRGDGHPWMATPNRPTPDCTNWCLPGVPDVWNEVTAAELLLMYGDGR